MSGFAFGLTFLAGTSSPDAPAVVVGVASVIDGDTIEIYAVRIRLRGIDAPESRRAASAATVQPASGGAASGGHPWPCQIKSGDRPCLAIPATPIAMGGQWRFAVPALWI